MVVLLRAFMLMTVKNYLPKRLIVSMAFLDQGDTMDQWNQEQAILLMKVLIGVDIMSKGEE
jgi:hypothetical protein